MLCIASLIAGNPSKGNEDTNLDAVREAGMSYLPCTLDLPNVMCVSASDPENKLWREV